MKNIIYIITLLISYSALAQIKPIETKYSSNFLASNTYFKDINGELNKFIGTWKYQDIATNTVFEITFFKEENISALRNCTVDRLNANFKLTINGTEQYNTFSIDYGKMFMAGGFYVDHIFPPNETAIEVPVSVNRYHLSIVEPNFLDDIDASDLTIEYENNFGTGKLNWNNEIDKSYDYVTGQQVNIYKMPLNMELIKQ